VNSNLLHSAAASNHVVTVHNTMLCSATIWSPFTTQCCSKQPYRHSSQHSAAASNHVVTVHNTAHQFVLQKWSSRQPNFCLSSNTVIRKTNLKHTLSHLKNVSSLCIKQTTCYQDIYMVITTNTTWKDCIRTNWCE